MSYRRLLLCLIEDYSVCKCSLSLQANASTILYRGGGGELVSVIIVVPAQIQNKRYRAKVRKALQVKIGFN